MKKSVGFLILSLFLVAGFLYFRNAGSSSLNNSTDRASSGTLGVLPKNADARAAEVASQERKPAQSPVSEDPLKRYLQAKDPQASWSIQTHSDGRPSHILGGRIPVGSRALSELLKEVSPFFGVRPEDLRIQKEEDQAVVSNSAQMTQYHGRYRVYGALLKAFSNPNTQEVYHIVNELRVLEEVDTRISVSRTEAGELARKSLGAAEIASIQISQEPVVYGRTPTDNQLVWRILLTSEKPKYQSREILIGAHSGQVVYSQSMIRH